MSDTRYGQHSAAKTPIGESGALYRTPVLTPDHVARYVRALLREVLSDDDTHFFDAVHIAFQESGIHPLASLRCEGLHFETLIERLNDFAKRLRTRLENDPALHRVLMTVVAEVLSELTIAAPDAHPTSKEMVELLWCCTAGVTTHISDYEAYAERVAHVATCAVCERTLSPAHV